MPKRCSKRKSAKGAANFRLEAVADVQNQLFTKRLKNVNIYLRAQIADEITKIIDVLFRKSIVSLTEIQHLDRKNVNEKMRLQHQTIISFMKNWL